MPNDPLFDGPALSLKSLTKTGMSPSQGDKKGISSYRAEFAVNIDGIKLSIPVDAATPDGWGSAAIQACDKLKAFAVELAELAEKEKTGPHPFKLY